ncbi:MAG: ankyrin repeat domain-containing protein [bacterium]|jgi:ankyrin repeat protein
MAKEQIDFVTGMRIRELILFGLITITAVLANLPNEYVEETLGLNPNALLAVLGCAVVFGLFLYLKFFFFLATVLLIVGANLPEQIAAGLDISKVPLILALITLVGVSLINYVVKMLPTGLEPKPKESSPEAIFAMFYGIDKNNVAYAAKVLAMNFDPNLHNDKGYTPLAFAAMKGNPRMVELLLRSGANPNMQTREGDTPTELALRFGHADIADRLKRARQELEARVAGEPAAQGAR